MAILLARTEKQTGLTPTRKSIFLQFGRNSTLGSWVGERYEAASKRLGETAFTGITSIVFSRTMKQQDHPRVTVVSQLDAGWVQALKNQGGKDIWLFGGSELFRSFLDSGYVDTVEVTVIPVLLGSGVPLLPPPYNPVKLRLFNSKIYRSGRVSLAYEVQH